MKKILFIFATLFITINANAVNYVQDEEKSAWQTCFDKISKDLENHEWQDLLYSDQGGFFTVCKKDQSTCKIDEVLDEEAYPWFYKKIGQYITQYCSDNAIDLVADIYKYKKHKQTDNEAMTAAIKYTKEGTSVSAQQDISLALVIKDTFIKYIPVSYAVLISPEKLEKYKAYSPANMSSSDFWSTGCSRRGKPGVSGQLSLGVIASAFGQMLVHSFSMGYVAGDDYLNYFIDSPKSPIAFPGLVLAQRTVTQKNIMWVTNSDTINDSGIASNIRNMPNDTVPDGWFSTKDLGHCKGLHLYSVAIPRGNQSTYSGKTLKNQSISQIYQDASKISKVFVVSDGVKI